MWIPRDPEVFGQPTSPTSASASLDHQRHLADLRPRHARHRVEVDPQLVGMVEVVGADRVRVEVEAAEVGDPGEARRGVEHDLVGRPARGERQRRGPDERRVVLGRALLEERLLLGAVDEALERHRPPADADQRAVGDGEEVAHEVELGVPGLGEVELVGVADRDLTVADLQDLLPSWHALMLGERASRSGAAPPHRGDAQPVAARYRPGRSPIRAAARRQAGRPASGATSMPDPSAATTTSPVARPPSDLVPRGCRTWPRWRGA